MRKESREFLESLIEAPSPSGYEGPARQVFRDYVAPYVDEIRTDVHGNVIAVRNPNGRPRIMLAGHIDEIGFLVHYVSDEGYLHVSMVGGVDTSLVASHQVNVWTARGPVPGVVGKIPLHLQDRDAKPEKVKIHKLWIDIGARNRADALKRVRIGDPVTFVYGMQPLLRGLAAGRGFDDKIGVFVVAETMRLLARRKLAAAVFGVATVQEELGLRGARTSAYGIAPDAGIAVDVEFATDDPEMPPKIILATTLTSPNPPPKGRTICRLKAIIRFVMPPTFINSPARINNGSAIRTKLLEPAQTL